jgi:beta-ureidopropionase
LVHEIELDMVREVRDTWQFFRDRRSDLYGRLTEK